jgi:hypothetical protein
MKQSRFNLRKSWSSEFSENNFINIGLEMNGTGLNDEKSINYHSLIDDLKIKN